MKKFTKLNSFVSKKIGDSKLVPEAIAFILGAKTDNEDIKKNFSDMRDNVAALDKNATTDEDDFFTALQKPKDLAKKVIA